MTPDQANQYRNLPQSERIALPGQIKQRIVVTLTGLKNQSVQTYPWEDPFHAVAMYIERRVETVLL